MFKKLNKKGFTLAELLIVVAIIGVLVAISIPIFTGQLNKAKYGADLANARSIYAQLSADYLTKDAGSSVVTIKIDGTEGTKVEAGAKHTVTIEDSTGTINTFKFSGIVEVNFDKGLAAKSPSVTVAECKAAGAIAQTFGGETIGS